MQDEVDGSNEYNQYQHGSLNTTTQLIKDLNNIDIVFHIGDISYANGYLSQWDQFTSQVEPIASSLPYMIARYLTIINTKLSHHKGKIVTFFSKYRSGNHERDWPDSGSFYETEDSGGECGVVAQTMFYVPSPKRTKLW